MKILMVTDLFPPKFAGGVAQKITLAKELKKRGVHVEFATDNAGAGTVTEDYESLTVHRLGTIREKPTVPHKRRELLFCIKLFFFLLKKRDIDVVFLISDLGYALYLIPLARLLGKRAMLELTLVGADDPVHLKSRKSGLLNYFAMRSATRVISLSTQLYRLSIQAGLDEKRLVQIPGGVDTERYCALPPGEKENLKERMGYSGYSTVFLAVGKVEDRKGYTFMLEAWKTISGRLPKSILLIAGPVDREDPYTKKLEAFNASHGLDNVRFLGKIPNVSDFMKIADCQIHCALYEGLPNTLIEAASSSVPIICRYMEGITPDLIFSPWIGEDSKTDDPKIFAERAIEQVTKKDPQTRAEAARVFRAKFDIRTITDRYIALFEEILK